MAIDGIGFLCDESCGSEMGLTNDLQQTFWQRWEVTSEKRTATIQSAQNVFQRPLETRAQMRPLGTTIGGSASAEKKLDGTSHGEIEVHVKKTDDSGNTIELKSSGEVKVDQHGKTSSGGKVKVSVEHEF